MIIHQDAPVGAPDLPVAAKEWPVLSDPALHGLPGDVVRFLDPMTEADPVAILANLLVAFGNAVGHGTRVEVGADYHHLNLNAALVGETAKSRKGTSWSPVKKLMHVADGAWVDEAVQNGLSSGEGLIHAVRDPIVREGKNGEPEVEDEGAPDKRLLVVESEFASVLKVMTRDGNTLSAIVRQAWDGGKLQTLTKGSHSKATDAHVSIIGHVTKDELVKRLSETDTAGGFTNRFLWLMVRRSKELPFGVKWADVDVKPIAERLTAALEFAKGAGEIRWGETAKPVWTEIYSQLSEGEPGMVGAAISRAEAQTLRLAALYAVLDHSLTIEAPHVFAAANLWQYAEDSARFIFGNASGDPVEDKIMEELAKRRPGCLTRDQIGKELFSGHEGKRVSVVLDQLEQAGLVRREKVPTGGRPTEKFFAV
jgi:hypothetical protein